MNFLSTLIGGWKMYALGAVAVVALLTASYLQGRSDGSNKCEASRARAATVKTQAVLDEILKISEDNAKSRAEEARRDAELVNSIATETNDIREIITAIPRLKPVIVTQDCESGGFAIDYDSTVGVLNDIAAATSGDHPDRGGGPDPSP